MIGKGVRLNCTELNLPKQTFTTITSSVYEIGVHKGQFELCCNFKFSIRTLFYFVAIRGLYSHQPAHSCKDIRDSGDSKGDGEYWIDPEKSGNPLKVFCDMTTDGGKTDRVTFLA